MPELKYEIEGIEPCPFCRKPVDGTYQHDGCITFSIGCKDCGVKMTSTVVDNTEGKPLDFITTAANCYKKLVNRWNRSKLE